MDVAATHDGPLAEHAAEAGAGAEEQSALQTGLQRSAELLAVLSTRAVAEETVETLSAQLDTRDPVFRMLLQAIGPGVLGLILVGSAGDSNLIRGAGIGLTAVGIQYGVQQPIRDVVRLALKQEANAGDGHLAASARRLSAESHLSQQPAAPAWAGRAQRRPSHLTHGNRIDR